MKNEREEELKKAKEIALARFYVQQKLQSKQDQALANMVVTGAVAVVAILAAWAVF